MSSVERYHSPDFTFGETCRKICQANSVNHESSTNIQKLLLMLPHTGNENCRESTYPQQTYNLVGEVVVRYRNRNRLAIVTDMKTNSTILYSIGWSIESEK